MVMKMTVQEAIAYIDSYAWSKWRLGLTRTRTLLERLGNPQKSLRFVHVAGTNGKGSTCAMMERVLRQAGYKTGFFPSPYIEEFRERIQVDGCYITEEALAEITSRVRVHADTMEDHPSQFELITAIGLLYFLEQGCDIVVLETGLGGEFDATNVIDPPEVCVITRIGLDHTDYLGDTAEEIARTKSGIIKAGADVVAYDNGEALNDIIRIKCASEGCPIDVADFSRVRMVESTLDGQTFALRLPNNDRAAFTDRERAQRKAHRLPDGLLLQLPLIGSYQICNAVVALTVMEHLRARGWDILDDAVAAGLGSVIWPARFEVLCRDPLFILDGGHNPQCAEALAASIEACLYAQKEASLLPLWSPGRATGQNAEGRRHAKKEIVFLTGLLRDKDAAHIIPVLLPYAAAFVCVTPDSERAMKAGALQALIRSFGAEAYACDTIEEGLSCALERAGERPVIAFGSLYMAGRVRGLMREKRMAV